MPTNFETDFFHDQPDKKSQKPHEPGTPPISISDVLNLAVEPIPWLIDNLLIQGGCSLLGAKPKVGKTTLTRCLALAVSRGEKFLGQPTRKTRVLMLTLEDKLSEVGRHFKSIGATECDDISFMTRAPRSVLILKQIIEENKFGLVVIDTMVLGVHGLADLNDYLLVTQSIAPYVQIARDTNAHIMFIHHLSKRERGGGDQILGSTALFGSVDSVLLLDRQKQRRVFSTIMRYGTDWPISSLTINESGHLMIGAEDSNPIRQQILDCLIRSKSPLTEKEIESVVYGRTTEKRKELRELLKTEQVVRQGAGSKNRPFQYSARL
ncbi:MAG: AAA family ATPase [Bdellovibrionaceae bacterium]|nr:AAA family ATPase [Pseudobdellovibrionaceae bacterium]